MTPLMIEPATAKRNSLSSGLDIVLVIAALMFGAVTLTYPFGRDQGLYYYVGREWALRGSIPYRDIFDHKTPGIYILNALTVLLFGEHLWGIRIAEILCILALGFVAAGLATPRSEKIPAGLRGFGCLAASIFYFGFYDFREIGEGEVWLVTLGLASCLAVSKTKTVRRSQIIGGALSGAAMMMKPSAIWFVFMAFALLLMRVREDRERVARRAIAGTIWFGVGALSVCAPILLYFAAHSALRPMIDIVVHANAYYVVHEPGAKKLGDIVFYSKWFFHWMAPFSAQLAATFFLLFVIGIWKRDRVATRRHIFGLFALLAGWASVTMQGKFYLGHWGVMVGPVAVVLTALAADAVAWTKGVRHLGQESLVVGAAAVAVMLMYFAGAFAGNVPVRRFIAINRSALRMVSGKETRDEYLDLFFEHDLGKFAKDNEQVGRWIREHSQPDDIVSVRGFQPQIYAVAQRHYGGRFFWTSFLISATRAYRRDEWLGEDRQALVKNPPRYVVVITVFHGNRDSADPWLAEGYVPRAEIGEFTILERDGAPR